jgi:hypothetical protein
MVATPHELATAAGLAALHDGGAAIDAVVAANAVLTVVYPDQTAIGGDCFLIYHDAATGELLGFNGSGRAPAAADRAALRAAGHEAMPRRGIHAVTVPGTVDAWQQAVDRFGRLDLDRLLRPAIGYARDGFPVSAPGSCPEGACRAPGTASACPTSPPRWSESPATAPTPSTGERSPRRSSPPPTGAAGRSRWTTSIGTAGSGSSR